MTPDHPAALRSFWNGSQFTPLPGPSAPTPPPPHPVFHLPLLSAASLLLQQAICAQSIPHCLMLSPGQVWGVQVNGSKFSTIIIPVPGSQWPHFTAESHVWPVEAVDCMWERIISAITERLVLHWSTLLSPHKPISLGSPASWGWWSGLLPETRPPLGSSPYSPGSPPHLAWVPLLLLTPWCWNLPTVPSMCLHIHTLGIQPHLGSELQAHRYKPFQHLCLKR